MTTLITTELFPDLEAAFVELLKNRFSRLDIAITDGVRVATKKSEPQIKQGPTKQLIVNSDGGYSVGPVLREEGFRVLIYTNEYEEANSLAKITEAILTTLPRESGGRIKRVTIDSSSTRVENPTGEELRLIVGTALLRATTITF